MSEQVNSATGQGGSTFNPIDAANAAYERSHPNVPPVTWSDETHGHLVTPLPRYTIKGPLYDPAQIDRWKMYESVGMATYEGFPIAGPRWAAK